MPGQFGPAMHSFLQIVLPHLFWYILVATGATVSHVTAQECQSQGPFACDLCARCTVHE